MAVNPDDYLHLVTKRPREYWGGAYIALSGAALRFDDRVGCSFPTYAEQIIEYKVREDWHWEHFRKTRAKYLGRVEMYNNTDEKIDLLPTWSDDYTEKPKIQKFPKHLQDVLDLVARGLNNRQVGRALGITGVAVCLRLQRIRALSGVSKNVVPIACKVCGEVFGTRHPSMTQFCSKRCGNRARSARKSRYRQFARPEEAAGATDGVSDTHQARGA